MVVNNIAALPAIAPIANPFLDNQQAEALDQLFQMYIQVGAEPNEENDIYLFGYYDTQQQEVVVQYGRGEAPHYGRTTEQMTLGEFIHACGIAADIRFTEAGWAGWGDQAAAPAFILNDTPALLALRFADLHHEGLAASFDLHIIQPVAQA